MYAQLQTRAHKDAHTETKTQTQTQIQIKIQTHTLTQNFVNASALMLLAQQNPKPQTLNPKP